MRRAWSLSVLLACSGSEPVPAPLAPTATVALHAAPIPYGPGTVEVHPRTSGGALEAQLVELRIDSRAPADLAAPLRAALPAIAKCYDRLAWIDVTYVARDGYAEEVAIVDPEATGSCVHDLLRNLKLDRAASASASGRGPARVTATLRIGPPLDESALPPFQKGKLLVRRPNSSCEMADPPNCPMGVVCPELRGPSVRCPTELGFGP